MCYDKDAIPPDLPISGGPAYGEDIILSAADGNHFSAYIARPDNPVGPQVVIFPDVRGLHQFYKELALRFAESGIRAVAIDYFGRTAGIGARDDTFEFVLHVQQLQMATFFNDVAAALAYLRADVSAMQPIFTTGFCLGGSFSLLAGTQDFALSGVIAFYASLSRSLPRSTGSVLEQAALIKCPVLGLFGGADHSIPVSEVQQLDETLKKVGVKHDTVIYPDAPHSFFDRRAVSYAEASSDAWQRMLGFIAADAPKGQ